LKYWYTAVVGNHKMKELILSITRKDFDIQYFSGTGAGGQHRNKHQNCVRMTHRESGCLATGQSSRSRQANEREAFKNIVTSPQFKSWLNMETSERILTGNTPREKVRKMMAPENLKIEHGPF
jgi:protein subunit release factor B